MNLNLISAKRILTSKHVCDNNIKTIKLSYMNGFKNKVLHKEAKNKYKVNTNRRMKYIHSPTQLGH